MGAGDKRNPSIWGMWYNSARDELFHADYNNRVVRIIGLHDNAGDLRDVYRGIAEDSSPAVHSVCHMRDSDSLLVCSHEIWQNQSANSLVLLRREGSEWRETHRVRTTAGGVMMCCTLSDSRVLVGESNSKYMELFHVQSGARIAHVHRIDVSELYRRFSATSGSDTLVAMSYWEDETVRVNRLRDDRLE